MSEIAGKIERILRARFEPQHFELRDDSARHAGHRGATSGGGHYHVLLVSAVFEGRSLLDRHRMVNEALTEMFGAEIHALGLTTLTPEQWAERSATEKDGGPAS